MAVMRRRAAAPSGTGVAVLIGFADALAAPETAWSLSDAGHRVVAFARAGTRPPLARSRKVELVTVPAPETDLRACAEALREHVAAAEVDLVMPLDDASVFVLDRAGELAVPTVGPSGRQAAFALDKRLQVEAASAAGLSVPRTAVYKTAEQVPADLDFPVVVKPALAVQEAGGRVERPAGYVCANEAELARAIEGLAGVAVLVQPFIRGVGEGVFGIARGGKVTFCSGHRRVRMTNPQGSGSSACTSVDVEPTVEASVARMLSVAAWDGLFMVELLRDRDARPWFVELNGRAWGSMALARRMGYEYPAWAVRQSLDPAFSPNAPATREAVLCRHLGREIVHLLAVFRGPKSTALVDWPSRWSTLANVMRLGRRDAWYNWRSDETGVFLVDALATVGKAVARRKAST